MRREYYLFLKGIRTAQSLDASMLFPSLAAHAPLYKVLQNALDITG